MGLFRSRRVTAAVAPQAPSPALVAPAVPNPRVRMPVRVFVIALLWLGVLVAAFFVWENVAGFRHAFPATLGTLPVATIWFGAVGGLLISLEGIYRYNRDWLRSYDYWHYTRPVLGAFIGVLGCLVFVVLANAAAKGGSAPKPDATFYDVLALVIGYREQSFRALVTRLTDTILLPKNDKPPPGTANEPPPSTSGGARP